MKPHNSHGLLSLASLPPYRTPEVPHAVVRIHNLSAPFHGCIVLHWDESHIVDPFTLGYLGHFQYSVITDF